MVIDAQQIHDLGAERTRLLDRIFELESGEPITCGGDSRITQILQAREQLEVVEYELMQRAV